MARVRIVVVHTCAADDEGNWSTFVYTDRNYETLSLKLI